MKKIRCFIFFVIGLIAIHNATAQTISDPNFANAISQQCPTCINLSTNTLLPPAATLTTLNVASKNISSLSGIAGFTALQTLNCSNNIDLMSLNVGMLTNLQHLNCSACDGITSVTLPNSLLTLNANNCFSLSSLGTMPPSLTTLDCEYCSLTSLAALPASLTSLNINNNNGLSSLPTLPSGLTTLKCKGAFLFNLGTLPTGLTYLDCSSNEISSINGNLSNLTYFDCHNNQQLGTIPTNMPNLTYFDCSSCELTAIPTTMPNVTYFDCSSNGTPGGGTLTTIPTNMPNLTHFDCNSNAIVNIPTTMPNVTYFNCGANQVTTLPSSMPLLVEFSCYNNLISTLPPLSNVMTRLDCGTNPLSSFPASLPPNLMYLTCNNNQLTVLPTLPSTLIQLRCNNNQLTALPALPSGLEQLYCKNNLLTSLPSLPNLNQNILDVSHNLLTSLPTINHLSLTDFICSFNQLTSIPALPTNLMILQCSSNQLTALPALPNGLDYLYVANNQLTSLSTLPTGLQELDIAGNLFTTLPMMTNLSSLYSFNCSSNLLTILETTHLPSGIDNIYCGNNPNLTCTEILPNGLSTLDYTNSPIVCVPNFPMSLMMYPVDLPVCTFGNAGPCFLYPTFTGRVYADMDNSGTYNTGDIPLTNRVVANALGTVVGSTDANGLYEFITDINTTTVFQPQNIVTNFTMNPTQRTVTTTGAFGQTYTNQNFRLIPNSNSPDLEVKITTNPVFRPGFETNIVVNYRNPGAQVLNGTLTLTLDNTLTYVSSSPSGSISGNVITWNYSNLALFEERIITVKVLTPIPTPLGTIIQNTVAGTINTGTDTNLENNQETSNEEVVGSYDPNDKMANRGFLSPAQLANGEAIDYQIRFQNTGTFPASFVEIHDTLSNHLDITTLRTLGTSHAGWRMEIVKDEVGVQPILVKWIFNPITLPHSSLDEPNSHGFVRFSIRPKAGTPLNTIINNKGYIYFDYNPAIITNTTQVVISPPPAATIAISGTSNDSLETCLNTPLTLTAVAPSGFSVAECYWYKNGTQVFHGFTSTYSINSANSVSTDIYTVQVLYVGETGLANLSASAYILAKLPAINHPTNYCSNEPIITLSGSPAGGTFTVNGNPATTFNPATALPSNTIAYQTTGCSTSVTFTVAQGTTVNITKTGGITSGSGITTITQACVGTPITLTANTSGAAVTNYQWQRNGVNLTGQQNPTLTLTSGWGVYRVRITNANACITNADTFAISFRSLPNAQAGSDRTGCEGSTANLGNTTNVNYTYSWYPTTGLSNPTISNPVVTIPSGTNSYTVYVSQVMANSGGLVCTNSDAVLVNSIAVPSAPTLASTTPMEVCQGGTINLTPNATGATSVNWYRNGVLWASLNPSTTRVISTASAAPITYTIRAKSATGCLSAPSNVIAAWVKPAPKPTVLYNNLPNPQTINLCFSESSTAILVSSVAPSPAVLTYSWKQGANFLPNENGNSYLAFGTSAVVNYAVKVDYTNGCTSTSANRGLKLNPACRVNILGEEVSESTTLSAYPNPAQQTLNIYANALLGEQITANLYNVLGEKVWSSTLTISEGEVNSSVDISALASGIYTLQLVSAEVNLSQKVVKE